MIDKEIANMLGVHRTTVTRNRTKYNIPKANLSNRKDKLAYCNRCKERFIIRRCEKAYLCPECVKAKEPNKYYGGFDD